MSAYRFIHTSDLHLGRKFSNLPEDIRGRLVEARHLALDRLAAAARDHSARDILIAGDLFDTETPSERVWRQALAAMAAADGHRWWVLPGNHDSLAAETLWSRFAREAPASVRVLITAEPVEVAPSVTLLPSPVPSRFPGRDSTAVMTEAASSDGHLRIGLAHGGVVTFGSEDDGLETIPIDRAESAGLDYLALGDWHGFVQLSDHAFYSGTPERDRFKHQGRGMCLAVTLPGPRAVPKVAQVETGRFDWSEVALHLTPEQEVVQAFRAALPEGGVVRRDVLLQLRASGWVRLPERTALEAAIAETSPEFGHFVFRNHELMTECVAEDLDAIATGGALRIAAERLYEDARKEGAGDRERRVADAALSRLFAFVQGEMG